MGSSLWALDRPSGRPLIVDQRQPDLVTPLYESLFGRTLLESIPLVERTGRMQQLLKSAVCALSAEDLPGLVERAWKFLSDKRQREPLSKIKVASMGHHLIVG